MDQEVKNQQFSYPSNLVIQREHPNRVDEPTGEPESLAGRLDPKQMGSLSGRERPSIKNQQKPQKKKEVVFNPKKKVKLNVGQGNVITTDIDENLLYRPKTKENRAVYEKVLALIHNQMQEQPQEIIKSVVDEILAVLKNESTKETDKRLEIESVIGKITNEFFSDLLLNSKAITDYNPEVEETQDRWEEEYRVPMVIDEEDAQDQESSEEAQVVEDGDDESQDEQENQRGIQVKHMEIEGLNQVDEDEEYQVSTNDIDAYWLHGKLNALFNDPLKAQNAVQEVLKLLSAPTDIECENSLVKLFGHENFEMIKLLHSNRHKIYYCTRLKQSQNEEQKQAIMEEMKLSDIGQRVTEQLTSAPIKKDISYSKGNKMEVESGMRDEELEKRLVEAINITDQEFQSIAKKLVDLESMVFNQQGHLMSNEKCTLPTGSYKISKKGYEEIYIPAVKHKSTKDKIVKIEELPTWAQPAFDGFKELNVIQSSVCDAAMNSAENLLICAPTGAGKTNVALLAMLQVIGNHINQSGDLDLSKFKIIYIAPMKALVNEQVLNFQKRLDPFGIKVKEMTGDTHLSKQQIQETQVLVATPEKWDILTRKSQANHFISLVKLIIIDEIHLLHDSRGPVLEAIVARTIRSVEERQELVRLVGLSATLPNYADVAAFIRVKSTGVFYFDNTYRPVPLQQQYIGVTEKKPIRRLLLMNEILYEKVSERAGKSSVLIFVHSRKETVKTGKLLKETAYSKDELSKFLKEDSVSAKVLEEVLQREDIRSPELRELLQFGIGVHHAGLSRSDRDLVEQLFGDKHLQVLISTATLAWGVNLPAHTVIIKGTQIYSPDLGRWVELSPQDILQMMGRAGRPRFDTKGEGIIITTYQELKYYLSLLNMQLPIESQFISAMADQLNAEIQIGSVQSLKTAVNWLGYTYLYVRMLRNPRLYQIEEAEMVSDPLLVRRRADLAHSAATLLDKHGLVKYDRKTGVLEPTPLGRIASFYYLKYPSVAVYNQHLKANMGMIELFKVFSISQEFKLIPIRDEEKVELQRLTMSVPVPIKGSAEDPSTKINVLLQAYISRLKLEGFALNADMVYITQSAGRIMRALFEICLKREWAQAALTALNLAKMVEKRMWNCMTPLRQFKGLPEEILKRVEKKEGITWEHLYQMSAQQIGELIRYQNLGKTVHKLIHKFPRIEIQAFAQPITRSCLRIDLQLTPDFQWDDKMHGKSEPFYIFVLDCDCEKILYSEQFTMKYKRVVQSNNKSYLFSFTVPLFEIMHPIYFIKVISDKWIACEAEQAIPFKNLLLPEPFSRVTELLGRSPLPISILKFPQIERVLQKRILQAGTTHFDPVQTQVFTNIYNSSESIFIGCPSFQTKLVFPYLATLQSIQAFKGEKCVYVAPNQNTCEAKYKDFVNLFVKSGVLHLKVCMLTGQITNDSKQLENSDIIVSNAQNWDIMSRRWRSRKGFQQIRLFIADDLHLLGESGSIMEVIVSRMRMVGAKLQKPIRIVGLGLSIADYKEIAEWIGSPPTNTFNFSPTAKSNPLSIIIQSFDQSHRPTRVNTMVKYIYPTLRAVKNQLSIIYVSDRKQARLCALDLMAMTNADGQSFLSVNETEIKQMTEQVTGDQYLQYTLNSGIGFLYECMNTKDEEIVLQLIDIGVINVVVITHKMALQYNLKARTVVILDNYKYDGLDKRYVDYSIPEVLEMIESAGDKVLDENKEKEPARCLFLTHAPKKDFYKKFIFEPIPVESHLNHFIANHLNAEIVAKNIQTTQDCIDWITWSFMYRRLCANPNYYNLSEISGSAINNYLSELIQNTIEELQNAKCISVEEDKELNAINSGIISNYYYINVQTVATFCELIKDKSRLKDLLFCLSQAQEFDVMQIRNSEEIILQKLAKQVLYTPESSKLNEPNTKALILLQAYFHRITLNSDLRYDQSQILELSVRLCTAMVDVASSNLWLKPAILCMQLCQMLVQALWVNSDSSLKQLPYFDDQIIKTLRETFKVEDIPDLVNMEDSDRLKILSHFDKQQIDDIVKSCNRFSTIEIKDIQTEDLVTQGDIVQVRITLERQGEDYTDFVIAPYYTKPKEEQWWILCADRKQNKLFGNKKITLKDTAKVELKFEAPEAGNYELTIYAISDSYIGSDQIQSFNIKVQPQPEQAVEEPAIEEEEQQ